MGVCLAWGVSSWGMISPISRHFPNLVCQEQVLLLLLLSIHCNSQDTSGPPDLPLLPYLSSVSQYIWKQFTDFKIGGETSFIPLWKMGRFGAREEKGLWAHSSICFAYWKTKPFTKLLSESSNPQAWFSLKRHSLFFPWVFSDIFQDFLCTIIVFFYQILSWLCDRNKV